MALDEGDRFAATRMPVGWGGEIARVGAKPTLLLASDGPLAMGADGNVYYPSHETGVPLRVMKLQPSGAVSRGAGFDMAATNKPLGHLNGLAAGADGILYYTENNAIRKVTLDGRVSTLIDNVIVANCPPGSAAGPDQRDERPLLRGLDVGADGTIFVAATACRSVLSISPSGKLTVLPQVANPWAPTGVALFGKDLYVLEFQDPDSDNRREMLPRVRKIGADGRTVVLATVTRP